MPVYHRPAIAQLRQKYKQDQATAKKKQHAASAHIPCGLQAYVLEEAHGICAVAGRGANRIPFSAACVRLRCANRTYAGLRRGGSRTTDVLTFAFRMWRCRLCMAENGLEMKLFERSEFASFPILRPAQLGIPQGQRLCVAFFGIPFLAKQKRYVVAGLPPASNRTATTEI